MCSICLDASHLFRNSFRVTGFRKIKSNRPVLRILLNLQSIFSENASYECALLFCILTRWLRIRMGSCVCVYYVCFGILFVSLFKSIAFKSSVTDVSIILDCMESVNPSFTFSIRYFYVNALGDALKIAQISTRHRRTQAQHKTGRNPKWMNVTLNENPSKNRKNSH